MGLKPIQEKVEGEQVGAREGRKEGGGRRGEEVDGHGSGVRQTSDHTCLSFSLSSCISILFLYLGSLCTWIPCPCGRE